MADLMKSTVFDRTEVEGDLISDSTYNAIIGIVLCWGFLVNWGIVKFIPTSALESINMIVFLVLYFASCLGGVYLFNSSTRPTVSFLGYNMVVVPFGMVINLVVSRYDPDLVVQAMQLTGGVTAIMMMLGTMYPAFFKKIHGALTAALVAMIVVELVQIFFFKNVPAWTDWIVAGIFCGYIGYDWGRAQGIPKTVDNAIDSAAAIYMDIINLFLRILRILGRRQ